MTESKQREQALTHLEVYADLIADPRADSSREMYMLMAAGALAVLEDLQIIDNETAEEFRKKLY
jgi:hypothetical protein